MDNNSFEDVIEGLARDIYTEAQDTLREELSTAFAKAVAKNTGDVKAKLISLRDAFEAEWKTFGKSAQEQTAAREKKDQAQEDLTNAMMAQGLNEAQLVSILDWEEDVQAATTKFFKARDFLKGPQ